MTRRHVTSGAPSTNRAPDIEYQDESRWDWLRRQNNPRKKNTPAAVAAADEGK